MKDIFNSKEVPRKIGNVFAQESGTGIVMLKWKDSRDVLLLTAKHTDNLIILLVQIN